MKTLISFFLITTISCMLHISAFAGNWEKSGDNWKYKSDDGTYIVNSWHQDPDHTWYYFGDDGYMWHDRWIDEKYYLSSTGGMLVDTITPDGYQVDKDGVRKSDETISNTNGYTNVFKDRVVEYEHFYYGGGDLYCDYEIYYNDQVSSTNGTVYQIDGITFDKDNNPYVMYHLVSGNEKLTIKILDPDGVLGLPRITLKPNETSARIFTTKLCKQRVFYIGKPKY